MTQAEYIAILFDGLGYTSAQRRDWLRQRFSKPYPDELTTAQRSRVIELLKAAREPAASGDK